MKIDNEDELLKKLHENIQYKHDLIRSFDRNDITRRKYNNRLNKTQDLIDELTQQRIEIINDKIRDTEKKAVNNKRQVTKQLNEFKKENRSRAGRKIDKKSYSSMILKALMHPKVNTEDKVITIVNKWKPGKDDEKLRIQTRNIISNIKNKKQKRYENFYWDDKNYMVRENG